MSDEKNEPADVELPPEPRRLLDEIAALSLQPVPLETFFGETLPRAVAALKAEAGAVWLIDAQRRLVLEREQNLIATGFLNDPMMKAAFEQPFTTAIERCSVVAHAARQETLDGPGRMFSLLMGGLWAGRQPAGLIQIVEAADADPNTQRQRATILEIVCRHTMTFLSRTAAFPSATPPGPPPQPIVPPTPNVSSTAGPPAVPPPKVVPNVEVLPAGAKLGATQGSPATPVTPAVELIPLDGVLAMYEHLRVKDAALVAANEGRRWLGVDRVSVAERVGTKLKLLAISGAASVNPRANVVQLLSALADKVVQSGERLVFDGESHNLPPLLEQPLADYLHESRSRAVVIAPLFDPIAWKKFTEAGVRVEKDPVPRPKPLGALVLEQISENPLPVDLEVRLDRVAAHAGLALRNAQEHERIFLLPVWRFLGGYSSWFRGRRLAQWLGGLAAVAAVAVAMVLVPWDYRVEGKGRLMPVVRQEVFAPWDGDVLKVQVATGDPVKAGDVLVVLKNDELHARYLAQSNLMVEKETQIESIRAQLSEPAPGMTAASKEELHFKGLQLRAEIDGIERQVKSLKQQLDALTVKARIDGVVATFRVDELLRLRPVRRGELLLQVMDPKQGWRMELDVPENRLGHMLEAQRVSGNEKLPVRYVLATGTEETWDGELDSLGSRSMVSEKEGAVIPVFATPGTPFPKNPQIGAEVTAKINCGKKPLGYVLFGDVIEFVRKRLWF